MQTSLSCSEKKVKPISFIPFLIIFIIYVVLRGYAWKQNIFLEDHDSISYMTEARMFLNMEFDNLRKISPDSTLFYPFMTAIFSIPGWDIEFGARLCSMFFGGILFLALIFIGRKIASNFEIAIGLLLLTCSPIFIPFSFAVLTEPTYIGTIYIGLAIFMCSYEKARIPHAVFLGIIFGFSFLNRIEGIIYLAIIPFFHLIYYWFKKKSFHDAKKYILFNALYMLVFFTVISPQIYSVSSKMGRLALNGREVWSLILHNPDGKSYEEKLFGLTYSEKEINLEYIQKHPEAQKSISHNIFGNIKKYIFDIAKEYDLLYQKQIGILIGPFGLIFFTLGFEVLYRRGNYFELFIISAFIVFNLIPPLMHNVAMRHIAIVGPVMLLLEGIGIAHISGILSEKIGYRHIKYILSFFFIIIVVGSSAIPLRNIYDTNREFDLYERYDDYPGSYQEAAEIIKEYSRKELGKYPRILSRKTYIAYYAEGEWVSMPYTDYKGLVKYAKLNNVDFLYLSDRFISSYPFFETFRGSKTTPDFLLVHETSDPKHGLNQLYRFIKTK
jgi:Dolichyl-phosphate-mannose-protein mannosyltransferase